MGVFRAGCEMATSNGNGEVGEITLAFQAMPQIFGWKYS